MVRAAALLLLIGCGSVNANGPGADAAPLSDATADATADAPPDTAAPDAAPSDAAPSSLVAWYTMDDPAQTTVTDASGHHHDGQCGGSTGNPCSLVAPGKIDGAYVFNGTTTNTTLFRVPAAPELNTSAGFTVTVWLNRSQMANGCVVNKGYGGAENNSWQACVAAGGQVSFFSEGSAVGHTQTTPTPTLPLNEWHHVALWWNGTTKATYIDGQRTKQDDIAIHFDNSDITIGADIDGSTISAPFNGLLDDVRIYDRALSDAEITALQTP